MRLPPFVAAMCIVTGALVGCDGATEEAVTGDAYLASPTKQLQSDQLTAMMQYARAGTAWHASLDWDALTLRGQQEILNGDGSDRAFFGALFHSFNAIPQGHQGVSLAQGCGFIVPYANYSRRGVCGRPHARGVVITNARANNSLGLVKGDVVVGLGASANHVSAGSELLDVLSDRPMCTASRPSVAFAHTSAASTIGDLVQPGETLTIESPDGSRRQMVVPVLSPALDNQFTACEDPFGRERALVADASIRPDGVAVIRVPGWTNLTEEFPQDDLAALEAYKARFVAKLKTAFDSVKSAPAIVWDMRGNGGGLTQVGLDIASGFPGAKDGEISYCTARNWGSDPPTFDTANRYASYRLQPGGEFAYDGKVAVIIEGLNYSAADYFPLAVKAKTNAVLVGSATAGAYGASSTNQAYEGPPSFRVTLDLNRCVTSVDDQPLEGRPVEPHIAVGYDPKDLVDGRDTVLERAVAELTK